MQKTILSIVTIFLLTALSFKAQAHCQVPCGIYDDSLRVKLMYEHITTIEKSMNSINSLSKEATPNYNQLVRWVTNKEEHATKIQEIVSQYFLDQRIKVVDPSNDHDYTHYTQKLVLLHKLSTLSMKAKQTTDLSVIADLRLALAQFEKAYFTHSH